MRIATGAHWTFLSDADLEVQRTSTSTSTPTPTTTTPACRTPWSCPPACVVEKVYVGYWFWGRPSPEQLWVDLREIFARIKPDFDPTTPEARAAWEASTRSRRRDRTAARDAQAGDASLTSR